jgi:hypothetical protein
VAHLLAGAQLAVRDVEKAHAGQRAQLVPRVDMGAVVVGVASGEAVGERDGAVSGDGQDLHELLEIGAVVFGMTPLRGDGALPAALASVRGGVVAMQHDRGRVVVQLAAVDVELADDTPTRPVKSDPRSLSNS